MRDPCGNAMDNHCFARLVHLSIMNTQILWTIHRGIISGRVPRRLIMLTVSDAPEISKGSISPHCCICSVRCSSAVSTD
jgi:hypothetical protein